MISLEQLYSNLLLLEDKIQTHEDILAKLNGRKEKCERAISEAEMEQDELLQMKSYDSN